MFRLWVYEFLNDRFGQVGDVGIMCSAAIFKYLLSLIFGIPHMESYKWECCMLKEAGQLSVEYNMLYILERLPGYADNWKKLDRVIGLRP